MYVIHSFYSRLLTYAHSFYSRLRIFTYLHCFLFLRSFFIRYHSFIHSLIHSLTHSIMLSSHEQFAAAWRGGGSGSGGGWRRGCGCGGGAAAYTGVCGALAGGGVVGGGDCRPQNVRARHAQRRWVPQAVVFSLFSLIYFLFAFLFDYIL
jgi:hypothetical protein